MSPVLRARDMPRNSLTTRTTVVPRNPISTGGGSCRLPGPTSAVAAVLRRRPSLPLLIAVEAMVFSKIESVDKSKTPYDWNPEACSGLAPVSEPAGSCGLPRDGLPAATMRATKAGRGKVGRTPVRCISPDDDTRCYFFFLSGPVLSTDSGRNRRRRAAKVAKSSGSSRDRRRHFSEVTSCARRKRRLRQGLQSDVAPKGVG